MDALSPMKTSPMKASPMKTSPIKDVLSENVSNQDRLVHKRRMVRRYRVFFFLILQTQNIRAYYSMFNQASHQRNEFVLHLVVKI